MLEITRRTRKCAVIVGLLLSAAFAGAEPKKLGSYNVNINETSVSGVSSGADMAVQFGVAHSSIVVGVGAIAGSPYYCAQGNSITVLRQCMIGPPPDVMVLKTRTDGFARDGKIDKTSKLKRQKVWLLTGYNDGIVKSEVVKALLGFYRKYNSSGNIYFKEDLPAAHALLTTWPEAHSCDHTGDNFVNKCKGDDPAGYDAAGLMLQHIYGKLNDRNPAPSGKTIEFSQKEFFPDGISWISMADSGYVYVPKSCEEQQPEQQPCRVHIAFHGCEQSASKIGTDFYEHGGYNEWADTNNIIVLYPQVEAIAAFNINPLGCWDWWGYTDGNYAKKQGLQITTVEEMLKRLAGNYKNWKSAPAGAFGPPQSLTALDSSPSRVALAWEPVAGASGYNIYRGTGSQCSNVTSETTLPKVNRSLVRGNSYSDSGLSESTKYCYQVKAVHSTSGSADVSKGSNVVTPQTKSRPPKCDPYVRTPWLHMQEGRAYPTLAGTVRAKGSDLDLGDLFSPHWVLLTKTKPDYFVFNQPCQ